jgi:para-aminobenzoate synthetase component 1
VIRPGDITLMTNDPVAAPDWTTLTGDWFWAVWHDPMSGLSRAASRDGQSKLEWQDPLEALRWMSNWTLPGYKGPPVRWVGYFGYDLGRQFEVLPETATDDLRIPLFAFVLAVKTDAAGSVAPAVEETPSDAYTSTFSRDEYLLAVRRCIDYIAAGDIFQVNLSQRISVPTPLAPREIFERLNERGGARYGALLEFGDFSLISYSPELFFHVEPLPDGRRRIINRPIKGTRPNVPGMRDELFKSEKDKAELAMIVDLQRNDLGRICQIGSVKVTEPRAIESHPTVLHGVATIEGMLRPEAGLIDILRAMFPCGSVTGCPKIRAMQIIEELEPVRRGPYCGAIGWIDSSGQMQFSVAIRTVILKDGVAHIPVGGGIVADSDPASEYDETLVKARAVMDAISPPAEDN